ncbi:MAG: NAD(P)H-binding protein, partial [Ignavibacteriaceae bacterium]
MMFDSNELLCTNLLTTPKPEVGTILVTGATGYVGGRLVPELLARGYTVKVMARVYTKDLQQRWPQAEIVVADALNLDELNLALKDVKVAYYLIHSLLLGPKKFEKADILAANNFRAAAEKNKLDRIIYLGALGDKNSSLSPHLRSRLQVAEVLQCGKISTTVLRAAIIIGSGSASYEILKNLVKNSPILFLPYWAQTKCQPISIRTLINILVGVLETEGTEGKSYDVGGIEILSYERLLKIMAKIQNKRRLFVHTSFSNFKFYSYIAGFLTPVPAPVIKSLFQSGKNEVLCNSEEKLPNSI